MMRRALRLGGDLLTLAFAAADYLAWKLDRKLQESRAWRIAFGIIFGLLLFLAFGVAGTMDYHDRMIALGGRP